MAELSSDASDWIDAQIEKHGHWRQTWSFLYFLFAALTVVAGAATTAVAGIFADENATTLTTSLAALTTILASLEKVLRFREKWDLHRNIQTSLEMIKLRASNDLLSLEETIDQIDATAKLYSNQLSQLSAPTTKLAPAGSSNSPGS